jgi:ribonuclease D
MDLSLKDPVWIGGTVGLDRLVAELLDQTVIGVDTESNSLFAYREQVCLIQFTVAGGTDYLVDPLTIKDLSPLGQVFASPRIEKVFHAAEYDLICLKRDFGFDFSNLFDTMQAARVLGRTGLGLGSLLEQEFGVQVDKRLQRANWARRPISAEMMAYARMDTHYLVALENILEQELLQSGRRELAEEDFSRLTCVPAGTHENNAGNCWRIAGVQDLSPRQAAVLMELCAYREERARAMDQPPFRVLTNQTLLELAQRMPRRRGELNQVFGLSLKLIDRYGTGILAAVERGIVGPPAYRPPAARPSDAVLGRIENLRNWRKLTAREMGVESDVILPRDVLEQIAERNPGSLEALGEIIGDLPWRLNRFGRQILLALRT